MKHKSLKINLNKKENISIFPILIAFLFHSTYFLQWYIYINNVKLFIPTKILSKSKCLIIKKQICLLVSIMGKKYAIYIKKMYSDSGKNIFISTVVF